jgi:hypothetical protein
MTSSSEDLLTALEAERAIYRTFFRFFRLMDTKQYELVGECFAPNAVIDYQVMPDTRQVFEGRDEFVDFVLSNTKQRIQMVAHVVGQHIVEWDSGRPRICAYATAWHWFTAKASDGDLRPADWATVGYVEDEFEQIDGDWLIARRAVAPVAGIVAVGAPPLPAPSLAGSGGRR